MVETVLIQRSIFSLFCCGNVVIRVFELFNLMRDQSFSDFRHMFVWSQMMSIRRFDCVLSDSLYLWSKSAINCF